MCGRLNLTDAPGVIQLMGDLGFDTQYLVPRDYENGYNLAPTDRVLVGCQVAGRPVLRPMTWWLTPFWAPEVSRQYAMFNARGETVATSPAFRDAFRATRCIVPASSFIEWQQRQGVKTPLLITPPTPFCFFAGIWASWRKDPSLESFAILTAASEGDFSHIHSRAPVSLMPEQFEAWLKASTPIEQLLKFIAPKPLSGWQATPVSPRINASRIKDPACLEPTGEAEILDETDVQ